MKLTRKDLNALPSAERRELLKLLGFVVAAPHLPDFVKLAAGELVGTANAAELPGNSSIFIEINLRDQWQTNHIFVPPGLATNLSIPRGVAAAELALHQDPQTLINAGNGFYLTAESAPLRPHLGDIAVVETCELAIGNIHGHEAANATRSPGRSRTSGAGRMTMWEKDPRAGEGGNDNMYSSTPTPGVLHSHHAKILDPAFRQNMIAFKGVSRAIHTVYHFAAGLNNAEVDRYLNRDTLLQAFANKPVSGVPNVREKHAAMIVGFLKSLDQRFFQRYGQNATAGSQHQASLTEAQKALTSVSGTPGSFSLASLKDRTAQNAALRDRWSTGVTNIGGKIPIWEQFAYMSQLITNGIVRTASIEHDVVDVHGAFAANVVKAMGNMVAFCLTRLIEDLKAAGLWNRTLIAVYTLDGGREPHSDSYGDKGKNTVMLAGGKVKGGYYGDVRRDGNTWRYFRPDSTSGAPIATGTTGKDLRVPGAEIWNTVTAMAGIPENLRRYPDVDTSKLLRFLMKA